MYVYPLPCLFIRTVRIFSWGDVSMENNNLPSMTPEETEAYKRFSEEARQVAQKHAPDQVGPKIAELSINPIWLETVDFLISINTLLQTHGPQHFIEFIAPSLYNKISTIESDTGQVLVLVRALLDGIAKKPGSVNPSQPPVSQGGMISSSGHQGQRQYIDQVQAIALAEHKSPSVTDEGQDVHQEDPSLTEEYPGVGDEDQVVAQTVPQTVDQSVTPTPPPDGSEGGEDFQEPQMDIIDYTPPQS